MNLEVNPLRIGKLPTTVLRGFLNKVRIEDKRVPISPSMVESATSISFGSGLLVARVNC